MEETESTRNRKRREEEKELACKILGEKGKMLAERFQKIPKTAKVTKKGKEGGEEVVSDSSEFFKELIKNEKVVKRFNENMFLYLYSAIDNELGDKERLTLHSIVRSWFKDCQSRKHKHKKEKTVDQVYYKNIYNSEISEELALSSDEDLDESEEFDKKEFGTKDKAVQYKEQIKREEEEEDLCKGFRKSDQLDPDLVKYLRMKLFTPQEMSSWLKLKKEQNLESDDVTLLLQKLDSKLNAMLFDKMFNIQEVNFSEPDSENKEKEESKKKESRRELFKKKKKEKKQPSVIIDPIYDDPLMTVYIHHGPYYRDTIIEHCSLRIKGLVERLRCLGASVTEKKWSHIDRLGIRIAGRFIFNCKVTDMEFDGDGHDATSDLAFRTIKLTLDRVKKCIKERSHLRPEPKPKKSPEALQRNIRNDDPKTCFLGQIPLTCNENETNNKTRSQEIIELYVAGLLDPEMMSMDLVFWDK